MRKRRWCVARLAVIAKATRVRIVAVVAGVAVVANTCRFARCIEVAAITGNGGMSAYERKPCLPTVIEIPCAPIPGIVAVITLLAESCTMHIVIDMTRYAGAVGVMKSGCLVTAVARHQRMTADQRKACNVVIEPQFGGPARRYMAAGAPITELAHVHVIRGMAFSTISGQRSVEVFRMATRAAELTMAVRQRKTGLGQMIEQHGVPVEIVVAASAVSAKATCVGVVSRVAAVAIAPGKIHKILSAMT